MDWKIEPGSLSAILMGTTQQDFLWSLNASGMRRCVAYMIEYRYPDQGGRCQFSQSDQERKAIFRIRIFKEDEWCWMNMGDARLLLQALMNLWKDDPVSSGKLKSLIKL